MTARKYQNQKLKLKIKARKVIILIAVVAMMKNSNKEAFDDPKGDKR